MWRYKVSDWTDASPSVQAQSSMSQPAGAGMRAGAGPVCGAQGGVGVRGPAGRRGVGARPARSQMTRRPRIRRAMTRRWIWLVPSPISVSFASRMYRSTG